MPVGAKATLTPNPITMARGPSAPKPVPFEQEAGDLGAVEQQVVGPFQGEARRPDSRHLLHRLVQGKACDETELGCCGDLARVDQKQAGIEVALGRRPLPPMAPPARQLLGRGDPELSRIAGSSGLQGVVVRRVRRLERDKPVTGGLSLGRQVARLEQRPRSGARCGRRAATGRCRTGRRRCCSTAEHELHARSAWHRSARPASSKYITLTMRR